MQTRTKQQPQSEFDPLGRRDSGAPSHDPFFESLAGAGEMGPRMLEMDWARTALGPIAQWPHSLKTAAALVLNSPVPVVMLWGLDGIMIYNDAYSVFAGGRHPHLLGSPVLAGWPEVADFNRRVMQVGLNGGTLSFRDEHLVLHRSGVPEDVWLNLDYSPIRDETGKPAGVLAIVVETTQRVVAERQVRELNEKLKAQVHALAELDRAKTSFFTNISHEFRTPLTLILGPTEDALVSPARALSGEDLQTVYRNELRLLKLVNALLDISRIEAGQARAWYEPVDLGRVTLETASAFRSAIERGGLEYVITIDPVSEPVYIDRSMWERIVLNLLSNALKFTMHGLIELSLRDRGESVELNIRDTGTGIAEEHLPHLFQRFHRIEGAEARTQEGSGIGLSLVHELVRLLGGTVRVSSVVGKGSTFTVTLPKGAAHLPQDQITLPRTSRETPVRTAFVEEALRWLPDQPTETIGAGEDVRVNDTASDDMRRIVPGRVVLADDNADMRAYLTRLLAKHWTVHAVANGSDALEAARQYEPDVVLTDVMMPGLDGFGLLRSLRADAGTAGVRVIVLSARSGEEARIEGLQLGADDYLVKPFSARELVARVNLQVTLSRHNRERAVLLEREQAARREAELQKEYLRLLNEELEQRVVERTSELTKAYRDLERRDRKIRRLVNANIVGVLVANLADGQIIEANDAFLNMLGYSREDLALPLRWTELTPPDWKAATERAVAQIAAQGVCDLFEKEYVRKDGSRVPVLVAAAAIEGTNGENVAFVLDLTERKRAEEKLRQSEAYLAEAQRLTHTGSWAWNPATDVRYWSEECYRVLGFDPRDGLPRFEEFIQRIHPDDQAAFRESAKRAAHKKLDEEVDYRIVHPGDAVRDIRSIGHPVFSSSGDLIEFTGTVIDITERKRAEEELRASEAKYRHLVDTTPAFIRTALPNGDVDFYNRGWLEYVGLPLTDLLGWGWTCLIHPDDVETIVPKWRAALEAGEPFVGESRVRRADGEYRWFLHREEPLRNEAGEIVKWYGSSIEIEERKIAEEAIRRGEAFLAEGQRLSRTGSWGWNASTGKLIWSQEHFRILGLDPQATNPSLDVFWERVHPDDRIGLRRAFESAIRDKRDFEQEFRIVTPDSSIRHLHGVGHAILNKANELVEFIGSTMDITERKRAEAALQEARAELERVSRVTTMGELAASIAHEVNQPLAGVVTSANAGLNWLAANPPNLSKTRETLERILRDGNRGGEVLARIRALLKRTPPAKTLVSVNQIVRDVLALTAGELRQHSIELSLELASTLPAIRGDSIQLQQVLLNLIKNAIETMAEIANGQQTLRIQSRLGELEGKPAAVVEVSDTGVGFSGSDSSRLFEAFHTTKPQGMGMGLWISRSIIESHHGRLTASPNDGPGATFVIMLPKASQEQA